MYYRIAIIAGNDPYAYGEPWQTYEQLKLAGHAVELLDADMIDDMLTPDGTPNWKLLGRFVDVFAPDYLAYQGESAKDILAALEGSGKGTEHPIRHFVVFAYVGPNNFGDELIFDILRRTLTERYPDSYISLIGHNTRQALVRHGVAGALPNEKAAWRAMLNGADLQITFAGLMFEQPFNQKTSGLIDLFHDPFSEIAGQTAMVLMGWLCDVPTVFLGMGVQPLENPDAKQLVKLAALAQPTFCTRDAQSAMYLRDAGVDPALIHEMVDLAFLIDPADYANVPSKTLANIGLQDTPFIVVSLREDDTPLPDELLGTIATSLDSLYETEGLHALFVDFAPEDRSTHQTVASLMKHAETTSWCSTDSADETLQIIAHASCALAMRLHCAILSTLFAVPVVTFDLNAKLHAFAEQLSVDDCLVALDSSSKTICDMVINALHKDGNTTQACVQRNRNLAQDERVFLYSLIDSRHGTPQIQPRYSRIRSERENEVRRLYAELLKTQQQLDQAQRKLDDIYVSESWRVGRAITVLPRAIKSLVTKNGSTPSA